jgi:hypothetical protein
MEISKNDLRGGAALYEFTLADAIIRNGAEQSVVTKKNYFKFHFRIQTDWNNCNF